VWKSTSLACTFAPVWSELIHEAFSHVTLSTGIATPPKATKSEHSNSSVQIQINLKSLFESVLRGTGWRRLIGSPELQITFHKRATKYRSLLRKMTYKDKGSYESSPPCTEEFEFFDLVDFGVSVH